MFGFDRLVRSTVRANQCGNSSIILRNKSLEVFLLSCWIPVLFNIDHEKAIGSILRWAREPLTTQFVISSSDLVLWPILHNYVWKIEEKGIFPYSFGGFDTKTRQGPVSIPSSHSSSCLHLLVLRELISVLLQLQPTPPGSEHPDPEQQVSTRWDPLHSRSVLLTRWDSGLGQIGFCSQEDTDNSIIVRSAVG